MAVGICDSCDVVIPQKGALLLHVVFYVPNKHLHTTLHDQCTSFNNDNAMCRL